MKYIIAILAGILITACGSESVESSEADPMPETPQRLMSWPDLTNQPLPSPQETIILGDRPSEIVDLWLPEGAGPHPVVIMVHGGCWQKAIADRTLMNYAAEALRQEGFAVWNIEYRGVDEPGGGYPGTFQDVARAGDALRDHAARFDLGMDRIVVTGHSAGGHLGLWFAARAQLPETSPLHQNDPLKVHAVLNVGGLADLEASAPVTLRSCLPAIMDRLTGTPSETRPDVFADTSPSELLPMGVTQISVNGTRDGIAPPLLGDAYSAKARAAGDDASYVEVPGGHVELIAPGTAAFDRQIEIIRDLFAK